MACTVDVRDGEDAGNTLLFKLSLGPLVFPQCFACSTCSAVEKMPLRLRSSLFVNSIPLFTNYLLPSFNRLTPGRWYEKKIRGRIFSDITRQICRTRRIAMCRMTVPRRISGTRVHSVSLLVLFLHLLPLPRVLSLMAFLIPAARLSLDGQKGRVIAVLVPRATLAEPNATWPGHNRVKVDLVGRGVNERLTGAE